MRGTDVRVILVGLPRSGKTKLAHAADRFVSDFIETARKKPQLHDPYYLYASLYRKVSREGLSDIAENLSLLDANLRSYRDTKVLRELSKRTTTQPIPLGTFSREETGMELKSFAITGIDGRYNLFVFDMLGQDFENFFRNFLADKSTMFLGNDRDEIVRIMSSGFLEFISAYLPNSEVIHRLEKIKRAKDLKSFFSWARGAVRKAFLGESTINTTDVPLIVLFSALAGLFDDKVKTAILLVYGPDTLEDNRGIEELKMFRRIALNTRSLVSNAPEILGITHAKIDLAYRIFVERFEKDPVELETRKEFIKRYVSHKLIGPYTIKSIHASIHDPTLSKRLQDPIGSVVPVDVPYNVVAPIYALFEIATTGKTTIPKELYARTMPYPYAHIYFALEGGL